jgi:hypothetical protein
MDRWEHLRIVILPCGANHSVGDIITAEVKLMVKYALLSLGVAGLLVLGEGLAPQVTWPTGQQERFVVRVPEDFPTIQTAIDAVAEGGTVLIGPGTYQESIQISKSIRLRGAGQELVQIQSVDHGSVTIDIDSEKPIQVSLEDLTVKNMGFLSSRGIRVWGNVQVLMERLTISGYKDGDGIMLSNKSAILSMVTVSHNRTGISVGAGSIIIEDASITDNNLGIAYPGLLEGPKLVVRRSLFSLNTVAALVIIGGLYGGLAATLEGNQIVKNFRGVYLGRYYQPDLITLFFNKQSEPGPVVIEMYNNQISGNLLYGLASSLECVGRISSEEEGLLLYVSGGVIFTGRDNEIRDNDKGDLCPPDYPWPPGFRK